MNINISKGLEKSDKKFLLALAAPILTAILTAIYAYIVFSADKILPPNLWLGVFLVAFLSSIIVYFIAMTIYLWQL